MTSFQVARVSFGCYASSVRDLNLTCLAFFLMEFRCLIMQVTYFMFFSSTYDCNCALCPLVGVPSQRAFHFRRGVVPISSLNFYRPQLFAGAIFMPEAAFGLGWQPGLYTGCLPMFSGHRKLLGSILVG